MNTTGTGPMVKVGVGGTIYGYGVLVLGDVVVERAGTAVALAPGRAPASRAAAVRRHR